MLGRWVTLGGLGWANLLDRLAEEGYPFTQRERQDLASIRDRIDAILARLAQRMQSEIRANTSGGGEGPQTPPGETDQRPRWQRRIRP